MFIHKNAFENTVCEMAAILSWSQCVNKSTGCNYTSMPKTQTGGRLNKKDGLTRYGDSHVKDKTS